MSGVVTIVAALAGSAVGGTVGARMQIQHERREAFRERMLAAADEAATAIGSALAAARAALGSAEGLMLNDVSSAEASAELRQAQGLVSGADRLIGRVDLLFGLDSDLGEQLRKCRRHIQWALSTVGPTPPELDPAFEHLKDAERDYRAFVAGARQAAESYGTWPLRRRRRLDRSAPEEDAN